MKPLHILLALSLFVTSAFLYNGDDHPPIKDRDRCTNCHRELLEPFDSTPLPEVVLYGGRIAVVLEHLGDNCVLSGIGWTGVAPCSDLQYPQNYYYQIDIG